MPLSPKYRWLSNAEKPDTLQFYYQWNCTQKSRDVGYYKGALFSYSWAETSAGENIHVLRQWTSSFVLNAQAVDLWELDVLSLRHSFVLTAQQAKMPQEFDLGSYISVSKLHAEVSWLQTYMLNIMDVAYVVLFNTRHATLHCILCKAHSSKWRMLFGHPSQAGLQCNLRSNLEERIRK